LINSKTFAKILDYTYQMLGRDEFIPQIGDNDSGFFLGIDNDNNSIKKYKKDQEKVEKRLRVGSVRELRILGRSLTIKEDRERLENELGCPPMKLRTDSASSG